MIVASFFPYTFRFKQPAGTSRGVLRTKTSYFICIEEDNQPDIYGWGECAPVVGLSVDGVNASQGMIGEMAQRTVLVEKLIWLCEDINKGTRPEMLDLAGFPALAFGVEMALCDLAQGGERILYDTPFSRGDASLPTHGLIWMDTHEGILAQIAKKAAAGFRTIKMKVGALPFQEELSLLAEIRRRFPADRFTLRLDANGAFAVEDALWKLEALARFDIHFIEQPIRPQPTQGSVQDAIEAWQPLATVCRQSPIPICLDEELIGVNKTERRLLLETILPQHIIIKPTLLGGFAASQAWMRDADELGIAWWINSLLESNIGLNAICQWTSALEKTPTEGNRVHGLGTGQLFQNNIPSPLRLRGAKIVYNQAYRWDLSVLC